MAADIRYPGEAEIRRLLPPARGRQAIAAAHATMERGALEGPLRKTLGGVEESSLVMPALGGHATKLLAPAAVLRAPLLGAGAQGYDQALALIEATGAEELRI